LGLQLCSDAVLLLLCRPCFVAGPLRAGSLHHVDLLGDAGALLIVHFHQFRDLHHLSKVVRDILLVVYAEQTVCQVVVQLLFIFLELLHQTHQLLDLLRTLAVLVQLRLKCLQRIIQIYTLSKLWMVLHDLRTRGHAVLSLECLHKIDVFRVVLEDFKVFLI